MARILIAEDEHRIAAFLTKGLAAHGHTTSVVGDGRAAAALARDADFDLLVLDLGLPGQHGLEALQEIRARGESLPVIILTADAAVESTVAGFDGGADDYLTKPFRFEELLARVRRRLRVADGAGDVGAALTAGDLELDLLTRRVVADGRGVDLTAREFSLLEVFMRHPDQVLSRQQLLSHVWGYDFDPESNIVDVYVRYLRQKLGAARIETVRGAGYRLVAAPSPAAP